MFETEIACYERHLAGWLKNNQAGKWAAIKDNELIGLFSTKAEAYQVALSCAGREPFLLREVRVEQEPVFLSLSRSLRHGDVAFRDGRYAGATADG